MSDAVANPAEEQELQAGDEGYVAPAPKALNEIIAADNEDESLQRYKAGC